MMKKIEYGFSDSPFGELIVARTWDGICDLQFLEHNRMETIHELARRWGVYTPTTQSNIMAETVARVIFEGYDHELRLDLRGTDFQVRVWQELLNIPFGQTASDLQVAERLGNAKAVRAVASAIAQNPIAMLIPPPRGTQRRHHGRIPLGAGAEATAHRLGGGSGTAGQGEGTEAGVQGHRPATD